ncbi:hypothetical protein [Lentzea aerocolonigenes]|nr:hypothetical protein [Lentzea aerocolonigenes]
MTPKSAATTSRRSALSPLAASPVAGDVVNLDYAGYFSMLC